ncbi:uncharacterized protein BCR38DRAFT_449080 [Pseudomassariella vexata]|uniref:Uncharacterized protein n=1 Tax=Pseudomassariella vexata TaxID=1141098 RepID=A0A1Y2DE99_9PEZI|nr:uncharacterized protein BCR38DRAFT_449080 [Pseudomassariella vexata]ORY57424.1 hypothetical protein BCR38DRAFT_449080 [Pseudomassariella vexata]
MAANFTAQDFTNANVQNARNPHPVYGYAHGPITNPNADWVPDSHAATEAGRPLPALSAAENAAAPNPAAILNTVNGGVCWIEIGVAGSNQMCGHIFASQPALRRHIRTAHPGAVTNPRRANASDQMILAGQNALKQFVVTQGWRNASFLHEPGVGPASGLIDEYATACERIAQNNQVFANRYGTRFHRLLHPQAHTQVLVPDLSDAYTPHPRGIIQTDISSPITGQLPNEDHAESDSHTPTLCEPHMPPVSIALATDFTLVEQLLAQPIPQNLRDMLSLYLASSKPIQSASISSEPTLQPSGVIPDADLSTARGNIPSDEDANAHSRAINEIAQFMEHETADSRAIEDLVQERESSSAPVSTMPMRRTRRSRVKASYGLRPGYIPFSLNLSHILSIY